MLKLLRWFFGAALGLCGLYLGAALLLGFIRFNPTFTETHGGIPIAVCSNGVHTDFVLPVKTEEVDWSAIFPPTHYPVDVTSFDHIGIGWGDLDFYRSTPYWRDFDMGIALRALGGLGPAALHVQYRPGPGASEDCARVAISVPQYRALADYVGATIVSTDAPVAPGYGVTDLFYAARGKFSVIRSCNVWVGEGLKAAGLPSAVWTPFAFQVLRPLVREAAP
jgi:uncharacterized protein (TIGR02117 family)